MWQIIAAQHKKQVKLQQNRVWEPCSNFNHVSWAPNNLVSPDDTL